MKGTMDKDRQKVIDILSSLTRYHWSENHPRFYVMPRDRKVIGVGAIPDMDYAAFNIAWKVCDGLSPTEAAHKAFLAVYGEAKAKLDVGDESGVIRTMLTLKTASEFVEWLETEKPNMSEPLKSFITRVFDDPVRRLQKL